MSVALASPLTMEASQETFSYEVAFSRLLGLISQAEQATLRNSKVAIAGMGGIGGIDLVTLARHGIGQFTIADADSFDMANINRQYGASTSTLGRPKVEVMAEIIRDFNPEAEIREVQEPIGAHNAREFLDGADLFIDAVDFFALDVRRTLFRAAAAQGIYGITAGPVGFSGIWIVFDPHGMSFDRYFDLSDEMSELDKVVAFAIGVAPKATHRKYMDMTKLDVNSRTAPSSAIGCNLGAAGAICEALKILTGRGRLRTAPYFNQFDAHTYKYKRGKLWGGNRNPLQRIKRRALKRLLLSRLHAHNTL